MSQTINAVGPVVSNDEAWLYEFLEMEYISPKAFDDAMAIGEDLVININSGGGDVFSGEEIYTKLCMYAQKVTINIVGLAASAASLIAMAGDQVNISTAGQIMIHNVSSIQNGDYHDMEKATDILKKANVSIAKAYAKKTGKSQEEILKAMDIETWLTAEDAIAEGFADQVIGEEQKEIQLVASATPVLPKNAIQKIAQLKAENEQLRDSGVMVKVEVDDRLGDLIEEKMNKIMNKQRSEKPKSNLGFSDFVF